MDIADFFQARMRNQCSAKECNEATEWRHSMEEVFKDTIDLGWKLAAHVNPAKPRYQPSGHTR